MPTFAQAPRWRHSLTTLAAALPLLASAQVLQREGLSLPQMEPLQSPLYHERPVTLDGRTAALPLLAPLQSLGRAGTTLWQDDAQPTASPLQAAVRQARPVVFDVVATRAALAAAPAEGRPGAVLLVLPLPDGSTGRFGVTQTSVMAPALAARYPDIRTYAGVGVDDRTATVRLDLTPTGFHAQILSARTSTAYIDPAQRGDDTHYLSFWKHDMQPGARQACGFQPTATEEAAFQQRIAAGGGLARAAVGASLRTFRLGVSATGEYTAAHGGTVPLAMAAIVTTVNRVVGVYERELAVRLELVPTNDQLVFTSALSDPFTSNNPPVMLTQNQTLLDQVLGTANYDMGHVFDASDSGVAALGSVCSSTQKAKGQTGSASTAGDAFYIDYVAHEMGHQLGGSHPFNGSAGSCGGGSRQATTAWEPGSGSTVMGYAGICGTDDLQPHSDAYFNIGNVEEIAAFLATTSCATLAATGNNLPRVTTPASGRLLPINTPFKLTGNAADADGDTLTFNWEELDHGPELSFNSVQVANRTPALFRSFAPSTSPTRYFPRLSDLVNNTTSPGERLPTVSRALTFKFSARDVHTGSAGTAGGVTSGDSLNLQATSAAGPFAVTAPNTALAWTGGALETVTWDVAGTTANGVDCATVNIRLSTDGGYTYPTVLAAAVPNTGSASVRVPSAATSTARIMVEAADNYFFDISNADFTINSATVCTPPAAPVVTAVTNTSASISFTPGSAASYQITTEPATTVQTVTGSTAQLTGLTAGTIYTVGITSSCGTNNASITTTTSFSTRPQGGMTAAPADLRAAAGLLVWPNPAGPGASLRITLGAEAVGGTATLSSVLGQKLRQRTFSGNSTEMPTAGLAAGTYLLTVQVAGQARLVRRVVLE